MAMIKCPECGKELSDRAASCPNCGCPIEDIRAKLDEIETEKQLKVKEKEEAEKIRQQKIENARNSITPQKKKTIVIISICIAVIAIIGGICGWYFGIKVPKDEAYQEYQVKFQEYCGIVSEYNTDVEHYNAAAALVISANSAFDSKVDEAQALIDCGDTPFEQEKLTALKKTVDGALDIRISSPNLKNTVPAPADSLVFENSKKADIEAATISLDTIVVDYSTSCNSILEKTEDLTIPDYSDFYTTIASQMEDLEKSYAIQNQITNPSEEWVISILEKIDTVANIAPATEDNDPNDHLNKPHGYTSAVFFSTPLLGTEGLSGDALIDEGTSAGGQVETYANVEDAEARNDYLANFDTNFWAAPGLHIVFGTMVIRVSDDLPASKQQEIASAIMDEMIKLD